MKWVEWVEPFGPNNEPVYMRIAKETAIAVQKHAAFESKGYRYESDERALDDFICVHWAKVVEDKE